MAIDSLSIANMLVYETSQASVNETNDKIINGFSLNFCDGINVIIEQNGMGKTSLLKMIYSAAKWSNVNESSKADDIHRLYSQTDNELLRSCHNSEGFSGFSVTSGDSLMLFELCDNKRSKCLTDGWSKLNIHSVFIPATEMLSHSKGFLALNEKYKMPFDCTQVDIIVNASLPEARSLPEYTQNILDKISKVIEGTVVLENDTFYVLKNDGKKIDFSLEAEGFRKLGLLWKLIRNGLLEPNSVLLWDEPEANLNPELFPVAAEILIELQKHGIQIFVATHSYNFAKYLEISRTSDKQVQFHNLYKSDTEICCNSAYTMEELYPNHIMIADEELLDRIYNNEVQ